MNQRRNEKKAEQGKNINYKNLISQYYDKDHDMTDIQEQVKTIAPEIQILNNLNSFEKKIDSIIKTKRYDIQELFMKPPKTLKRLLRIKLVKSEGKVKIFGSLYPETETKNLPKLTSFFKQIKLYVAEDKVTLQTWKRPTQKFVDREGVMFKLPDPEPQTVGVSLTQIFSPPKFEVDENLRKIVNFRHGTRVEVLEAFWAYVKAKKLQDTQNKQIVNADDFIRNAFKCEKLTFATINNRTRELLIPIEPIRIELSGSNVARVLDLMVDVEERPNVDILPFFAYKLNEEKNDHPYLNLKSKIKKYEKKYQEHSEKLRRHLAKREIYMNFKPETIEAIIRQQYELLKVLKKGQPLDEYNKLEFLLQNEDEVEREIKHYLEQINTEVN